MTGLMTGLRWVRKRQGHGYKQPYHQRSMEEQANALLAGFGVKPGQLGTPKRGRVKPHIRQNDLPFNRSTYQVYDTPGLSFVTVVYGERVTTLGRKHPNFQQRLEALKRGEP